MRIIFNLCEADNLILRIRKFYQNFDHPVNYDDDTLMRGIRYVPRFCVCFSSFVIHVPGFCARLMTCMHIIHALEDSGVPVEFIQFIFAGAYMEKTSRQCGSGIFCL